MKTFTQMGLWTLMSLAGTAFAASESVNLNIATGVINCRVGAEPECKVEGLLDGTSSLVRNIELQEIGEGLSIGIFTEEKLANTYVLSVTKEVIEGQATYIVVATANTDTHKTWKDVPLRALEPGLSSPLTTAIVEDLANLSTTILTLPAVKDVGGNTQAPFIIFSAADNSPQQFSGMQKILNIKKSF